MTRSGAQGSAGRKDPSAYPTSGRVLNWGWFYDLVVWFSTRGRESALRQAMADLLVLRPGESALDVGCGTGTLALVIKQRVGEEGRVCGIDPGRRQIARARSKAARAGRSIDFQVGGIERLPYPDQSFDAAVTSFVMHHLPDDLKRRGLAEIARTLKPGGRLLVVDFKGQEGHPPHRWLHHAPRRARSPHPNARGRRGPIEGGLQEQLILLEGAGFAGIETGDLPFPRQASPGATAAVGYALGRTPSLRG